MKTFPLTLAASKSTEITALVDGMAVNGNGYFFTAAMLENNETEMAKLAKEAAGSATLQTQIDDLNKKLTEANTAKKTAEDSLAAANLSATAKDAEIVKLNAEIKKLEKEPAGEFENTNRGADNQGGEKIPFHESDKDPSNVLADSLFGKPVAKKEDK